MHRSCRKRPEEEHGDDSRWQRSEERGDRGQPPRRQPTDRPRQTDRPNEPLQLEGDSAHDHHRPSPTIALHRPHGLTRRWHCRTHPRASRAPHLRARSISADGQSHRADWNDECAHNQSKCTYMKQWFERRRKRRRDLLCPWARERRRWVGLQLQSFRLRARASARRAADHATPASACCDQSRETVPPRRPPHQPAGSEREQHTQTRHATTPASAPAHTTTSQTGEEREMGHA